MRGMPVAHRSRGNSRKWHSLHGSAGGGSSAGGNPVRYADCAATSSYRNESIETFSHRYTAFLFRYLSLVRRRTLDIPHKASVNPRYAPIKYSSVYAERSLGVVPRNLEPEPRILCILSSWSPIARGLRKAVLRAEKQLDAVPPFLHLEESSFLRRIISIGTQRVFPLE